MRRDVFGNRRAKLGKIAFDVANTNGQRKPTGRKQARIVGRITDRDRRFCQHLRRGGCPDGPAGVRRQKLCCAARPRPA